MDELKINTWKQNFEKEIQNLQIEFDAFFMKKKLNEYYSLKVNKLSDNLSLEFTDHDELPKDIVDRIVESFNKTKPEDSI